MKNTCGAIKISDRVYWVGAVDEGIRDFHGYNTARGTTYNAYLILGQKPILIDTVKEPFFSEMMARIASVINPEQISYIVSNHSELDHSGALLSAIDVIKPEKVFASKIGAKTLKEHFRVDLDLETVNHGEKITLGDADLVCVETRMLHWPDSMFTYFCNDRVLFSQDGFGMHLATRQLFSQDNDRSIMRYELMKYFANILLPYVDQVAGILKSLGQFNFKIDIIAPDHGPIWSNKTDIDWAMSLWRSWLDRTNVNKILVVYDTMWDSTAKMASAIADGIVSQGAQVKVMPLSSSHRSDVAAELLEARAIAIGSPTINHQIFPTVADILCYLKGLKPMGLEGQVFGSYGWSGESIEILKDEFKSIGINLVGEALAAKYVPDMDILNLCRKLGSQLAGV